MCSRLTMNFNTEKATLPADKNKHKENYSWPITKLRDDSFNPSRGWVFCPFVTLPVSLVLFTQITMLYH